MAEVRRLIGAFALAADTVPEADRRAVMAARLPRHAWPEGDLRVVAVEAETGDRVVFTAAVGCRASSTPSPRAAPCPGSGRP